MRPRFRPERSDDVHPLSGRNITFEESAFSRRVHFSFLAGVTFGALIGVPLIQFSQVIDAAWPRFYDAPVALGVAIVGGSTDDHWYATGGLVLSAILYGLYAVLLTSCRSRRTRIATVIALLSFHAATFIAAVTL